MKNFDDHHKKTLALILGGGRGTRLHPLTEQRSKPAVPIAGKYRLVDIPISNCLNSRINKIFVLTQFNSASLNRHIKHSYNFDLFSKGFVDILAAEQTFDSSEWYQGTADAVRQSYQHFTTVEHDYVLILSGDQLYQMDFKEMLQDHINNNADLTIATIPVDAQDATGFGIMKTDEMDNILSFIEKPDKDELKNWVSETGEKMKKEGREYLASMGIYLFNKKVLKDLLFKYDGTDFGKNIIPASINEYKVNSYQFEGYWTDIGTIGSFHVANIDLTRNIPSFNLYDNDNAIFTHARMLPPAKVVGTSLENVVLSEGAIVHASRIENSVIGIRTRIGHGCNIYDSYLMGSDYYETIDDIAEYNKQGIPAMGLGERCHIKNAILDKNVRIGNNVTIMGNKHLEEKETKEYKIVDGIVVVKKNAVIPNGTVIGG
ncbi:MAG: glucose-1-phosphate adenylyltransferase [Flavobacteriaceae bacterium]|nr:glucose-1-phosphate adenylyltransferase [Flavobacteriaceae bacterium]